ncbi:13177_t:CDS:2, partial [Dentiscutata heterogama]
MSNVYTLNNIKDRGDPKGVRYRLGSICESELENALHSSIKSASVLANEYKDLQDITSFRDKINELNSLNRILEQERDDLNSKKHELEAEVGHKDSEITSLGAKINELEKSFHELNIIGGAKADPDSAENSLEKEFLPQETNT